MHMNTRKISKLLSILLIIALCISFVGCDDDSGDVKIVKNTGKDMIFMSEKLVKLNVLCDTSSASGEQLGWFADLLLSKFNVKLNYVYVFDEGKTNRYTGEYDLILSGSCQSEKFTEAINEGYILDLNSYDMEKNMPFISSNLEELYLKNEENSQSVYGIYAKTGTSASYEESHYRWDMRFDYYEELGMPEIVDINDWVNVLEQMQAAHPYNSNSQNVYAVSYPSDANGGIIENVSMLVSGYYGYQFHELGYYDWKNKEFYGVLDILENGDYGPYLSMLKINNHLYNKGLLDPESETQSTDECVEKIQNEQTLASIVSWLGSMSNENMYPVIPKEANISHYSLGINDNCCMSIDSETKYPELCMAIIDYFYTPEGYLTLTYGPKGDMWDYTDDGNTYLTELGIQCIKEGPETKYKDETFSYGMPLINMQPYDLTTTNPRNGESYNHEYWISNVQIFPNDTGASWAEWTNSYSVNKYMRDIEPYSLIPVTSIESIENTELADTYNKVSEIIKTKSWEAIKASTDEEFDRIVKEMLTEAIAAGYEICVEYYSEFN